MRYRRSPHLVAYWMDGRLVCVEYEHRVALPLTPDVMNVLKAADDWRTVDEIGGQVDADPEVLSPLLEVLAKARVLRTPEDDGSTVREAWSPWMPSASFFHFVTRDGVFKGEADWVDPASLRGDGPPPPFRAYPGPRTALPQPANGSAVASVLKRRRTHRAFGERQLGLNELATLLRTTWEAREGGPDRNWFRTSPSAGARHPIEAYVGILAIDGVEPGLYHFDSRSAELVQRRRGLERRDLTRWLAGQSYFEHAAAVVFMTAVFERTVWRYPSPRAYRSIFIDAGHLAQTFCLVATDLNLAPFTTMAFKDTQVEQALGIDGRTESVVYVAGVGPTP